MKKSNVITVFILILISTIIVSAQDLIPFNSDYWEIENSNNEPQEINLTTLYGKSCLRLAVGHKAWLKDSTFSNFRLEMDIAGVVMPGLGFRAKDKRNYEYLYLRVMSNNREDALQYIPVFNEGFSWQLYNYPDYEKVASFPERYSFSVPGDTKNTINGQNNEFVKELFQKGGITLSNSLKVRQTDSTNWQVIDYEKIRIYYIRKNIDSLNIYNELDWIHIKLEVIGKNALFYVEDMNTPQMAINSLKHNNSFGYILLKNNFADSYYANFQIESIDDPQENTEYEVMDAPSVYLSKWDISDKFKRNDQNIQGQIDSIKTYTEHWRPINSEPSGLINLSRYFEETEGSVLLKTQINSPIDKNVELLFDYAKHLIISLNSEIIFSDSLRLRDNQGRVIDGEEKTNLMLEKGNNEIIFVVTSDPFKQNWGFIAKIMN
ncbi:MAG: hypothetical protein P8X73_13790 [Ignavibacteriaceae bacterium]